LKKTSFLHYYQVISAIPRNLLTKVKSKDLTSESISHEDPESFRLTENVNINLLNAKSKDFYWLVFIGNIMISMQAQGDGTKVLQRTKQIGETYLGRSEKYARKTS